QLPGWGWMRWALSVLPNHTSQPFSQLQCILRLPWISPTIPGLWMIIRIPFPGHDGLPLFLSDKSHSDPIDPLWHMLQARSNRIDGEGIIFTYSAMRQSSTPYILCHATSIRSMTSLSSLHKDLLLSIWKMKEMLKMQFARLIAMNLAGRDADFVLSGQSKNAMFDSL
nr:hypothetical protein [Tanacetum cinerariifolium]